LCCSKGRIVFQEIPNPLKPLSFLLRELTKNRHFLDHVRAWNNCCAVTSLEAKSVFVRLKTTCRIGSMPLPNEQTKVPAVVFCGRSSGPNSV